jgi:hypothetical protein
VHLAQQLSKSLHPLRPAHCKMLAAFDLIVLAA